MTKTVTFKNPTVQAPKDGADVWVGSRGGKEPAQLREVTAAPEEPMARLTIDVPVSAHRKFKAKCAGEGVKMADLMRQWVDEYVKA